MKPKTIILLVVAIGCGLGAAYMTSELAKDRPEQPQEKKIAVVYSHAQVPAYQPIKEPEKYFRYKEIPESAVLPKAITDIQSVKGKVLSSSFPPDNPLTEDKFFNKDTILPVPQGYRAISMKVNQEVGIAGFILPGSRVDVLLTVQGNDPHAKVVLQNMLVLAVDSQDSRDPDKPSKVIVGQTVTLAAKPEEANKLALAQSVGQLRLTLRSVGDNSPVGQDLVRVGELGGSTPSKAEDEPKTTDTTPKMAPVPALPSELPTETPKVVKEKEEVKAPPAPAPTTKDPVFRQRITTGLIETERRYNLNNKEDD